MSEERENKTKVQGEGTVWEGESMRRKTDKKKKERRWRRRNEGQVDQTRKRRMKGRCRWQGGRRKCRRVDRKEGIQRRWEETKRGIIF